MKQQLQQLAAQIRANYNRPHGVIVIHDSKYCGWMDRLRNPEHWMPGTVAVEPDQTCHIATGGNDYDGAERWEVIA